MRAATETEGLSLRCDTAFGPNDERRCEQCGAPLPARRRRWCANECGRAWADQHSWPAARLAALERAGWVCQRCGRRALRFEVHHRVEVGAEGYSGPSCAHHAENLEVLCSVPCHRDEHTFRRQVDAVVEWAETETFRAWADGTPAVQMVLPGIAA